MNGFGGKPAPFSAFPLNWGYRGGVLNVFKLVLGGERLKLSTVELWTVVCGESVWMNRFQIKIQIVNNCSDYIQLEEIRIAVSCNQVVGTIELEQVCMPAC